MGDNLCRVRSAIQGPYKSARQHPFNFFLRLKFNDFLCRLNANIRLRTNQSLFTFNCYNEFLFN